MNTILTLSDVAAMLQVHPNTVRKLVKTGVIPAAKINKAWMFVGDDVVQAIRKQYSSIAQSPRSGVEIEVCPSTSAAQLGGFVSQPRTEKSLDALLERKTSAKRKSSTIG